MEDTLDLPGQRERVQGEDDGEHVLLRLVHGEAARGMRRDAPKLTPVGWRGGEMNHPERFLRLEGLRAQRALYKNRGWCHRLRLD